MEGFLAEHKGIKAELPVDLNSAALTGARISMKKSHRCAIIVNMGDSTAAVTTFSLQQHNAASGGTSKALAISNPYFHKAGAATSFTKVDATVTDGVPVAASSYDVAALFADAEGILVFEVLQEDLDVNNGFTHISINALDSTAAKLASIVYILNSEVKAAYGEVF